MVCVLLNRSHLDVIRSAKTLFYQILPLVFYSYLANTNELELNYHEH